MKGNKSKNELVEIHGLPGATAVLVIQMIENEKLSKVDPLMITEMWNKTYKELSVKNSKPRNACVFHSYLGLIFRGHVKIGDMISINKRYSFGINYQYVKTAIDILKTDYDHMWPSNLKPKQLWKEVFQKLKMKEIAYNSQLHVLKA
jgi:hypothetical protein